MLKIIKEKISILSACKKIFTRRSILLRTTALCWLVIIFTLAIFIFSIIPYQRQMLISEMESRSRAVASSFSDMAVKSMPLQDYSGLIDHCISILKNNPGIMYLVITRSDGFSTVITPKGWKEEALSGFWQPASGKIITGKFIHSRLVEEKVFHYTQVLEDNSGIKWGWVHIGLSLDKFTNDLALLYWRSIWLAIICIFAGLLISFIFSKQMVEPLLVLTNTIRRVKEGQLSARVEVHTGDEVEILADSFNQMTAALLESQKELVTTKEYIENIVKSVNDILIVTDKVLNIKIVNRAACELLGYREDELIYKPLAYLFTGSDYADFVDSALAKLIKDGFIVNREMNYKTKEGNFIPTFFSGAVIRDKAGKLEGVVIIAKDITDRKRVERVLRDSEERYRMLFEQSPIGIGLASFEGRIISLNAAMLDMLGYSREETERFNMADLYANAEDRKKIIEEVLQNDNVSGFSTAFKRRNSTPVDVILNVSKINLMGKELLQITCLDITERRRAEEKVKESERKFRGIFDQAYQFIGLMKIDGTLI
ncbi:MAG: PAS domain S-box protein, partial [Candidatus Omnitrophica bacterium]|nr:PAS domain S-box protein [Candidatus Omnitrophota bacterium]